MSRPLRIEFPGAVYHVTARGDRREAIFRGDDDRADLLGVVAQALDRFDASMLAYCLMGNHYHFVLHTRQANLSRVMRQINGVYTQRFNRRHGLVGHLFQGRFKAILVDRDAYLLEVCRYVELNPVRAHMVGAAGEWPWSSYRSHTLRVVAPVWLDTEGVLACVLGFEPRGAADRGRAAARYEQLVAEGRGVDLWGLALQREIYLGDDRFVERMQQQVAPPQLESRAVPRAQRGQPRSLADWLDRCASREEALYRAYTASGSTMAALAQELGLSVGRVSQLIAKAEAALGGRRR